MAYYILRRGGALAHKVSMHDAGERARAPPLEADFLHHLLHNNNSNNNINNHIRYLIISYNDILCMYSMCII